MSASSAALALWPATAARAAVALVVGLTVTFVSDHSAGFGLGVFAAFATLTALAFAWTALRSRGSIAIGYWACAGVTAASGVLAFIGDGLSALVVSIVAFAAITGAIELALGVRLRDTWAQARDSLVVGILSLITALVVVLIPFDFANAWQTVTKEGEVVSGVVTAQVLVVGVFGAYAFVLGVYLAIAAVSARLATRQVATSPQNETITVSGEG